MNGNPPNTLICWRLGFFSGEVKRDRSSTHLLSKPPSIFQASRASDKIQYWTVIFLALFRLEGEDKSMVVEMGFHLLWLEIYLRREELANWWAEHLIKCREGYTRILKPRFGSLFDHNSWKLPMGFRLVFESRAPRVRYFKPWMR